METAKVSFRTFTLVASGLFFALTLPSAALAAAPTVSSFTPIDGASAVDRNTNLVIIFDQTVIASGSTLATPSRIRIFHSNGTVVEDITASGSQVTVSSATVTINPSVTLAKSTTYYIQIETEAFVNALDESYAGISNTTTWNFSTIGGGAAARQIREKLLEGMPEYYDTEAPCLADVGIFDPNGSCGSTGNESDEDDSSQEEPQEPHTAAPVKVERTISPELEQARLRRSERLLNALTTVTQIAQKSAAPEYSSHLQQRACERVEHRFSGNQKMIDRVNERLDSRFGFTCDVE